SHRSVTDATHHAVTCTFSVSSTMPSPTALYTLSLHDALPISAGRPEAPRRTCVFLVGEGTSLEVVHPAAGHGRSGVLLGLVGDEDRKSTRLNSSHLVISYAVFCLKKKKKCVKFSNLFVRAY